MYQAVKIIPAISKCLLNDGEMQSQVVQQQLIEPLLVYFLSFLVSMN